MVDHFLGLTGPIVLFERVEDKRLNKEKQTTKNNEMTPRKCVVVKRTENLFGGDCLNCRENITENILLDFCIMND